MQTRNQHIGLPVMLVRSVRDTVAAPCQLFPERERKTERGCLGPCPWTGTGLILHGRWAEPLGPCAHRAHRCLRRRLQPGTCQNIEETRCNPRVGDTSNTQAWGCLLMCRSASVASGSLNAQSYGAVADPTVELAPHWRWLPIEVIVTERTRRRPRRGHRRCGSAMPVRTPRTWACACTGHVPLPDWTFASTGHVHVPLDRAGACTGRVHATTGTGVPCMV